MSSASVHQEENNVNDDDDIRPDEAPSNTEATPPSTRRNNKRKTRSSLNADESKDDDNGGKGEDEAVVSDSEKDASSSGSSRASSPSPSNKKNKTNDQQDNDDSSDSDNHKKVPKTAKEAVDILNKLEDEASVHEALFKITNEIEKISFARRFVAIHNGIPSTMLAMQKFPNHSEIQNNGLYIFMQIVHKLNNEYAEVLFEQDVLGLATSAMQNFPNESGVYQNAFDLCGCLWECFGPATRNRLLTETCPDLLKLHGHALVNPEWDKTKQDEVARQMSAKNLWRISEYDKGRKLIIQQGVHHQLDDRIVALARVGNGKKSVKNQYVLLKMRVMQDCYGDLSKLNLKKVNSEESPEF